MKLVSLAAFVASLTLPAAVAYSQEHAGTEHPAGHGLGTVHFATSCSLAVSPQFDHAVALLHSFEFGASIKSFNEVIAADSTCSMAYWGIALSRWTNPMAPGIRPVPALQLGQQAIEGAKRVGVHATERERGYVNAVGELYRDFAHTDQKTRVLNYSHAMEQLATQQKADTEAMIFYAISLTASASPTDKTYANQLKAGRILEDLWPKQPDHPGIVHYIIHTYDYPPLAAKARTAAQRYATIAPLAAHALHMPSHTFTRLGLWKKSVETNKESMEAALSTGSISDLLHASDYSMYADLQMAKYADAKKILDGLPALAARFDPKAVTGAAPGSAGVFALAAIPARWTLERGAWSEAAALEPKSTAFPYTEAMTYFARAVGASRTGNLSKASAAVDSLASIQQRLSTTGEAYWAEQVAIQHLGAQAWLSFAEHKNDAALTLIREATAREDATEKNAVTPGPLAPAREQLGDMLMLLHRPVEARAEYRAVLIEEPNRRHSRKRLL